MQEALLPQDKIDAVREARPGLGLLLREGRRRLCAAREGYQAVVREVARGQSYRIRVIGLVRDPNVAVRADAEEVRAVVVAVLDSEAEAAARASYFGVA